MNTVNSKSHSNAGLSGAQKSAILMVTLGEKLSAEVLRQLDEGEVHRISRAIATVPSITSEIAEHVLSEFYQMILAQDYVLKGGIDYARSLLVSAFGAENAKRLVDRVSRGIGHETAGFDALQKADPQQLANFIHAEHPQTVALILSHLGAGQAADLLSSLPLEIRDDVAVRMANLDRISPEIVSRISNVIGERLKALGENKQEAYGGVRAVADMFNHLDQIESKQLLARIEAHNATLGAEIRQRMFVFEDLLKVETRGIRELLERVDRKVITVALKGTSEALKNHILGVMSSRGAEMLKEDMEVMGPVRMRDVEKAQQEVIAEIRKLEAEGIITLNLSDEASEEYVS